MKILIVDDHALMRRCMAYLVEDGLPDADVVEAEGAAAALDVMRESTPDLALVDVRMPELDGLELLRAMKLGWPSVPVIMISIYENAAYVKRALSDGAAGYLLKDATPEFLGQTINAALSGGGNLLSPRAIQATLEDPGLSSDHSTGYDLIPREHDILVLLLEGLSNRTIAQHLYVSEKTVKANLVVIFRKLGVANRTQAAMMALQLGVGAEELTQ